MRYVVDKNDDKANDFLIVEFETIRDFVLDTKETGNKRINFLVGMGTAIGGLLIFFFKDYHKLLFYKLIFTVTFGVLFIFALDVFLHMVNRRIVTIEYLRAMNRIRRYFLDRNGEIEKYLYFPTSDKEPPYVDSVFKFSGLYLVSIVFCVVTLWGIYIGLLNIIFGEDWILNVVNFWPLILITFIFIIWSIFYTKKKNKTADSKFKINFPPSQ